MTPRIRIRLSAAATMLGLAFLPAGQLPSQITLEAQQGTAWANSLTIPQLTALNFRWKWDGSPVTTASWQISFTSPASTTHPTVVKSVRVDEVPARSGQYASFQIAPDAMPSGVPGTFYVRVRSSNGVSAWLPVAVAQGARTATDDSRAGTNSPSANLPLAPPPLIIPGGGASEVSVKAQWIKQIQRSNDGVLDEADEIYVVFATANLASPASDSDPVTVWMSGEYANFTSDSGVRPIGKNLWGMKGAPSPLASVKDVTFLALVLESDSDTFHSFPSDIDKALTARLIELKNTGVPRENMPYALQLAMFNTALTKSPHRPVSEPKILAWTENHLGRVLDAVGNDEVIYQVFGDKEGGGRYEVEFRMKREK